jgi:phosphoglycerol transferase MdoB-like AlkP superfamily enzyme
MKRPLGVWIIGILALVGAVIELLAGLTALGVGALDVTGVLGIDPDLAGGRAVTAGVVLIIIAVLYLLFALSFLGLKRWAWAALLVVSIITVVAVIVQMIFDGFYWSSLPAVVLPLIVAYYLSRREVRNAFSR